MDAEFNKDPYTVKESGPLPDIGEHQSASAVLRSVIDNADGDAISIGRIIEAFGERAFGFVLILFSLPNCVPAPPGSLALSGRRC